MRISNRKNNNNIIDPTRRASVRGKTTRDKNEIICRRWFLLKQQQKRKQKKKKRQAFITSSRRSDSNNSSRERRTRDNGERRTTKSKDETKTATIATRMGSACGSRRRLLVTQSTLFGLLLVYYYLIKHIDFRTIELVEQPQLQQHPKKLQLPLLHIVTAFSENHLRESIGMFKSLLKSKYHGPITVYMMYENDLQSEVHNSTEFQQLIQELHKSKLNVINIIPIHIKELFITYCVCFIWFIVCLYMLL